jgi:hypothetical protein
MAAVLEPAHEVAAAVLGHHHVEEGAFPGPGKATYTVLSGRFDRLPALR